MPPTTEREMPSRTPLPLLSTLVLLVAACAQEPRPAVPTPGLVQVVATGTTFSAPDSVPSGWLTFRFDNQSTMTHFGVLERMPDGVGIEEQQRQAAPVFQAGMNLLAEGRADEAMAKFGELPAWFSEIVFVGGPGLTAPGHSSEVTVHLEPGIYVIECYVKTGTVFHSFNPDTTAYGMVHQLVVTNNVSPVSVPTATVRLTLSCEGGIGLAGDPVAGPQTVAVEFADQTVYPNFAGHDVHLVRLADGVDRAAVAAWMDWRDPKGLTVPSPAEFLSGLNEMPAGSTGYLSVTLTPGEYAWISEVPDPQGVGFWLPFSVSDPE